MFPSLLQQLSFFTHTAVYILSLFKIPGYPVSLLFIIPLAFVSMPVFLAMILCVIMDKVIK